MFCIHCGVQNPDCSRFCNSCGKSMGRVVAAPASSIRWGQVTAAATLLLVVVAGAIHFLREPGNDVRNELGAGPLTAVSAELVPIARTLVPRTETIVTGAFTLPAGGYTEHRVEVGSNGAQLKGNFQATGGNSDIEVYVTNEDGLVNFQRNLAFGRWYDSRRSSRDTFSVALPTGVYYLIFSNRFSWITPKAASAEVMLEVQEFRLVVPERFSPPFASRMFSIPAGGLLELEPTSDLPEVDKDAVVHLVSDGDMWAEFPGKLDAATAGTL